MAFTLRRYSNLLRWRSFPLQNHIHLSDTIGTTPEYAPTKKWSVAERILKPRSLSEANRTIRGSLFVDNIFSKGKPLILWNVDYVVKIRARDGDTLEERRAYIQTLHGKQVYFCDSYHANDDEEHVSSTRIGFCLVEFDDLEKDDPGMATLRAKVSLGEVPE